MKNIYKTMNNVWHKLKCMPKELQLSRTLDGGQSFRWKKVMKEGEELWIGVFKSRVWFLKQDDEHIFYQYSEDTQEHSEPAIKKIKNEDETSKYEILLHEYFQLDINLQEHCQKWCEVDPKFKIANDNFYGIRVLKQDPVENIFSFICSANNHISRIGSMVEKLAKFYGEEICTIDGDIYYSFPTIEGLCSEGVEAKLRKNGFGYRADYIAKSAQLIKSKGGDNWVEKLKEMKYDDARTELMTLKGVGRKVADCICLMSLGHSHVVPVDTHVYQIAKTYMPKLANQKSVTEKLYSQIVNFFENIYGPLAGWAHTVLFCADLKKFQSAPTEKKPNKSKSTRKTKQTKT